MSRLETPMVRAYWDRVGGTLIEEFLVVRPTASRGRRLLDGLILPKEARRLAKAREVSLKGKPVIALQAKASRLGMYLMGQALFSAELLRPFDPLTVRSVALCTADDDVLRPLLLPFPDVEVVVMPEFDPKIRRHRGVG